MINVTIIGRLPAHVTSEQVVRTLQNVLHVTKKRDAGEIAVRFTSESEISRLNWLYRRKKRATDVLSFAPLQQEGKIVEWGDVVICPVFAAREARRRGIALQEEIIRLVAHGFLHLMGFDHATEAEELRMFRVQEQAVQRVCS